MAEKPGLLVHKTVKCSSCGVENVLGSDSCEQCLHSLMQKGLPRPKDDDRFQHALMTAPVGKLLTGKDLLVCKPTDTVLKVVKVLQTENKSCVLVYDKKHLVGIVSLRDLLRKIAGKYDDLSKIKIAIAMTPSPEFVRAEDPIAYAVNKMAMGGFRHIPVLDQDGAPYSIISIKDVLGYLSRSGKPPKRD